MNLLRCFQKIRKVSAVSCSDSRTRHTSHFCSRVFPSSPTYLVLGIAVAHAMRITTDATKKVETIGNNLTALFTHQATDRRAALQARMAASKADVDAAEVSAAAAAAPSAEELGEQLRRIAVENYDWETRALQMLAAYGELKDGTGVPPMVSGIASTL